MRPLFLALALLTTLPGALCAQDEAEAIARNLADGELALKEKRFHDARIALLAVLELQHDHANALAALSDVHLAQERPPEALAAAIASIDAPRPENKNAAATAHFRALASARTVSPTLAGFIELRAKTAGEVLRLRARAEREKRTDDARWLLNRASAVAPYDQAVQAARAGEPAERRNHALYGVYRVLYGAPSAVDSIEGFRDVTDPGNWRKSLDRPTVTLENGEIVFRCRQRPDDVDLICEGVENRLEGDFSVKFEAWYKPLKETYPRIFFTVRNAANGATGHAIVLKPCGTVEPPPEDENQRLLVADFARLDPGKWNLLHTARTQLQWKAQTWTGVQINWRQRDQRLVIYAAGGKVMDQKIEETNIFGLPTLLVQFSDEVRFRRIRLKTGR